MNENEVYSSHVDLYAHVKLEREIFTCGLGPQGAGKAIYDVLEILKPFCNK